MREVLGETTPLHDITRDRIERLFELLKNRPQNASQRYPGLTTEKAISAAVAKGDTLKLSAKSLENYYTNVLAVFNFAIDEKFIDENPAKFRSLRKQFRNTGKKKKALFTADQLSKIFHAPLYVRGFDAGEKQTEEFRGGRFFVPLLALFQGLRCNEACQLYVEDVKEEDRVPFLAIREEREDESRCEKRLKNKASKRDIPIHPAILRAGFMEFVAKRRRDGDSLRLFPELPLGKTGRYSNPFSKWFSRFLRSIFQEKPAATFHSFRHHFRETDGSITIEDPQTKDVYLHSPETLLNHKQLVMVNNPYMLVQYIQFLKEFLKQHTDIKNPIIRADIQVSVNGKPFQYMYDPTCNLSEVTYSPFKDLKWIIPVKKP